MTAEKYDNLKDLIKILDTTTSNRNQSWEYVRVVSYEGNQRHKLRVRIRRNAYDFQSFAIVERWDGNKWHEVANKPISYCRCQEVSYVTRDVTSAAFQYDYENLIALAITVVDL